MKSSTLLDSIAFQLTPTRTRCDLVITANGKTEKIASGLLDPFVAHLKAAQEQIGKGGYSIVLKPNHGSDTSWFTKGTVERFVRFVSTPEILERAYTIESEILQIEKAISLQTSNDTGLHNAVDKPLKREYSLEGSKPAQGGNEEKAIVLYQPANLQAEDGSSPLQKNSKVQLVQVLETRKSVLQKEQGMAFARAIAASLDIDHIAALIAFAECFGASRMLDACKKFVHLWKAKHESGQWVEVEATEAMSYPADVSSSNSAGIVFHSSNEHSQGEAASEKNGKPAHHDQSQPHPMFSPWQMNAQANGMPVFPPYPMQGMPYYQNYPGNNMFFQSPYPPHNEPRVHPDQRTRRRRHSMDSVEMSSESEAEETDTSRRRTQDDGNRGGKSSKKRAGKVVIRNINYIARAKQGSGDSDVESCSDDDTNDDSGHNKGNETRRIGKPVKSSSGDDGNWQAFQNFLLTDADESRNSVNSMFAMEGKVQGRRRQNANGDASSTLGRHSMGEGIGSSDRFDISGDTTCTRKQVDDQMLNYRRAANLVDSSFDPVISNGLQVSADNNRSTSQAVADESFVGLHKTDQVAGDGRAALIMKYELPSALQKAENHTVGNDQSNYEPNVLNLMPNRAMEVGLSDYDPAVDYQMQAQVKQTMQQSGNSKKVTSGTKQGPRKTVKDHKLKAERLLASTRREKPYKSSSLEDARARAEKLRAYKADLQKLKKEKEDEQLKRLEALKIERQKRIAARSGTTVPQSPSASQQARKSLPKLSPISHKGSKFSDTEPGSSSPLQRSTIKLVRKVSSDSSKVSKPVKSNSGSQSNGNRLTRSASSLSVRHEENNGPTPETKATIARIRRLSEPKNTVHHVSSGKTQSAEGVSRRRVAERAETRKRSADSDNAKSSSLPEQKLNTSKGSLISVQKRLTYKEKLQKPGEKSLSHPAKDGDDSSVVEKTVVMLEFKKPENPNFHQHDSETSIHNMQRDADGNVGGILEEDTSIPPPASPIIVKEIECKPSSREVKGHSYTRSVDVSSSLPNVGTAEEPYRAPYARISSTEDRCMVESEYGKALPTSFSMASAGVQTTTALVSDGQKEDSIKISQAVLGKHQGKDSPKGFRKLLKFGKWSSAGSDSSIDLDKTNLEGAGASDNALNGSSSEVFTLKNLLTQEESSSTGNPQKKSSRSFSLLSPFKSKSSEKKATA